MLGKGQFITFEGGEGAGKSTQIKRLAERLEADNHLVMVTREPGGSTGAEILRHVLLSGAAKPFGPKAEVLLFSAARLDHMQQKIIPALEAGKIVLCDRFYDSTRAYQGAEGILDEELWEELKSITVGDHEPDLTFVLDLPAEIGLERITKRAEDAQSETGDNDAPVIDRFEEDNLETHVKRRILFLQIAREEADRCVVIDATKGADEISDEIWAVVKEKIPILKNADEHQDNDVEAAG